MEHSKIAKKKRLFSTLLVGLILTMLGVAILLENRARNTRNELDTRIDLLVSMLANAGYGGMIHNFKNYVLRGKSKYYTLSLENAQQILSKIENYRKRTISKKERNAIDRFSGTVKEYMRNLHWIANQETQKNPVHIDQKVKVSDENAIQAISYLINELNDQRTEAEVMSQMTTSVLIFFFLIFSTFLFLLYRREINRLESSSQELLIANQELMEFSYRTSHDLKAPLTTIKGLSECILEDLEENEITEAKKNVITVGTQAERLEKLVLNILNLAKTGHVNEQLEKIEFEELLDEVHSAHSQLLKDNQVSFKKEISLSRTHLSVYTPLYQIITNLVVNSIKYHDKSKSDRFVTIRLNDDAQFLMIEVADNGIGIPTENKESVYELFKKFHSDNSLGSGMGMYIVKKSILSLNGTIDYETSPHGTEFKIKIPTQELL